MKLVQVHQEGTLILRSSITAIGSFDGVHLGHQTVMKKLVARSKQLGVPSVVYTFDPPPRVYFKNVCQLTTIEEKVNRIRELGVNHVVLAQFNDEYLNGSVSHFISDLRALHPVEIIVGSDFRFGKNRSGGVEDLSEYFQVRVIDQVCCEKGKVISSSRIRDLLLNGENQEAQSLLNW